MAERYDFYVHDNRKITFNLTEPIMREDSGVTDFVFHIPKILNELEVSDWAWWLVFVNAKKEKYSIALTLSDDPESPLENNLATYTVDYAMSIKAGAVQFALEAINTGKGGAIDNEWHTQSYEIKVKETLQGNQAEYAETESDIISALLEEVRTKMNQIIGGATPTPVSAVSQMTDTSKLYLLTTDGEWYYYNGSTWTSGGVYGAGVTDAVPTQGSNNAVKSGGVYDEITSLKEDLNTTDAKSEGGSYTFESDKLIRGNLNVSALPWINNKNVKSTISTIGNNTIKLYAGDVITLDSWTDRKMYVVQQKNTSPAWWTSGWQTSAITVPNDGLYGFSVSNTAGNFTGVDDITVTITTSGAIEYLFDVPLVSNVATSASGNAEVGNRALSDLTRRIPINRDWFWRKNLDIPQLRYYASTTRASTKDGVTIPLKAGDIVTLSTGVFYYGYYDGNGNVVSGGSWVSSLTVSVSGKYVFCVRYSTEATITDYDALYDGFCIKTTGMDVRTTASRGIDLFRFNRFYDHMLLNKINGSDVIIPLQSIPSIFMSKRLGFKVIEANVRKTADNKYIVTHGTNGAFGDMFEHVDGTTDISATMINSVTLDWIEANIRYKSLYGKYKTAPPTLEEYLTVCKKLKMIPLVQIENDPDIATITNSIMGKDNYIAYNSNRQINGGFIMIWRDLTSKSAIIEECNTYGKPLMYGMANPSHFADADLQDIVGELHANGYLIGFQDTYISEALANKYMQMGFDFCATTWNINDIDCGNAYNVSGDIDFSDFDHNGTIVGNNLVLTNGQYVRKWGASQKFLVGVVCYVRFSGSLKVNMSGNFRSGTYTSDGSEYVRISAGALLKSTDCMLTSTGITTIYELKIVASVL